MKLDIKILATDPSIIGGGMAGCYAALTSCEESGGRVLIAEETSIRHSGYLAASVNAIDVCTMSGKTSQDYVDYAWAGTGDIIRGDLPPTMTEGLNRTAAKLESLGLAILKDARGQYVACGGCNIRVNSENIKLILTDAVAEQNRIAVFNRVNVLDYVVEDDRTLEAYATGVDEPVSYVISAKAVLCTIGDAAGLRRPNHLGFPRHKMWYPLLNTDVGYAVGTRVGAEMTTFEMRFITPRRKDTIAPTGTLVQGAGAKQINSPGEVYGRKYGITTSQWVHGMVTENLGGHGPRYLRTAGITKEQDEELQKAYLNIALSQALCWMENGCLPSVQNAEIEDTESYIAGGHIASGYRVNTHRETTIGGLSAVGDVAGGCSQKYVTGTFMEGEIAARVAVKY